MCEFQTTKLPVGIFDIFIFLQYSRKRNQRETKSQGQYRIVPVSCTNYYIHDRIESTYKKVKYCKAFGLVGGETLAIGL